MAGSRLDALIQLVENDASDSFSRYALAMEYSKLGDHPLAVGQFKRLIEQDSEYVAAYYQLGKTLEAMGLREEAADAYRAGVVVGRRLNDAHTVSELQTALDELEEYR